MGRVTLAYAVLKPAGLLRRRTRVLLKGANHETVFWSQPYKSRQHAKEAAWAAGVTKFAGSEVETGP
jgi:hypothetical protein